MGKVGRKWNITDEQIRVALQSNGGNISQSALSLGIPRKTLSRYVSNLAIEYTNAPPSNLYFTPGEKGRVVVTCVQNNTELHQPFIKALKRYCKHNDAQLLVIPIRYKNVNAYVNERDYQVHWPSELYPYYLNYTLEINKNLCIMGDVKIQATAESPLSGMENIAGSQSAIIGHSQIQLRLVATPTYKIPKLLSTTGSASLKNYSLSKAGKKASVYHSLGAVVVEWEGDIFGVRQIEADDDGCFYELDTFYSPDKPLRKERAAGLKLGDIHNDFLDPGVKKATWDDPNSIINICKPEKIYLEDVLDFHTQSHHNRKDFFLRYLKHKQGYSNVQAELDRVVESHNTIWGTGEADIYYLPSNHHEHLTRWLNETDPKDDLENAKLYYQLKLLMLEELEKTNRVPDPFALYMKNKIKFPERTFFPRRGEEVSLLGIDIQHGDKGVNGARGSLSSFAKSGMKTATGHTHILGREKGAVSAGVSGKRIMDYIKGGFSSHVNGHLLIYPSGKVTTLIIIGGWWRLNHA